jgi:WD40 repeat protein
VITMTPGAHPFESLREAAAAAGGSEVTWHTDDLDVLRTMQNLLDGGAERVVLVVDQLEELVTQAAPTAAARFIENLVAVADDPAAGCSVLATVRADFTDDLLAHPVLAPHLSEALVTVVPPDPSEITEAAVGPAHRVGLAVEPELVAELVADMTDQPGALPLFEYALTELCSGCAGPALTRAGYRQLGGLRGALARRAEQTYQALEPAEQAAARTALLRLVTVTASGTAVRQRATRASLASLDAHAETAIDAFDRARLLTFDQDPRTGAATVDVAHEALISGWPRLASWVQESRDDLRLRQLLADEVAEWEAAGRHAGYLLAGSRLAAYDDWPRTPAVSTTEAERTFLSAGRQERERRAAAERRASRRLRGLVAATTIVAVVASMLAVVAVERGNEAQAAADRARARDLAAASATVVDRDSDLALLLALEATRLGGGRVPEAVTALHTAVSADRLLLTVDEGVDAALLPEGRVLVGGDQPRVIDTATGQVQAALPGARPALHVAASDDGTTAATATGGTVVTWDLTGPTQLASRTLSRDAGDYLWDLAVTDEGDLTAAQADTESGGLTVLDSTDGATVARRVITGAYLDAHTGLRFDRAGSVVWRPNESHLMSLDVATQAWDTVVVDAETVIVEAGEMSDGSLLTAHDDGWVRRWTRDGDALDAARVSDASLSTLAVDPTSDTVVVGDRSGRVHVWQPGDGGLAHVVTLTAGTTRIIDVCVRDGLVSAVDQQRRVRVWSLEQPYELGRWTGGGPVAISEDGAMLASALASPPDGAPTVIVRSLPEGDEVSRVPPPDGARLVGGMDFCDDTSCLVITYDIDDDRGFTTSGVDVVDPMTGDVLRRESGAIALLGDIDASGRLLALAICWDSSPAWVMDMDAPQMAVGTTGLVQVARFDGCGRGVAFSHDGGGFAVLTSASSGSTSPAGATVVDMASGLAVTDVAHEPGERGSVRFSDDDSMLLTAGADGAARIWDTATGEQLAVLASDRGSAETALWVTDERVAVSHADGTVALWHADSGALLAEVDTGSTAPFVAVTPDGQYLVTSAAGQTQMWTLDADELLDLAASRVSRTFTPVECQRYDIDPCPAS